MNRFLLAVIVTVALLAGASLGAQEPPQELPRPTIKVSPSPRSQLTNFVTGLANVVIWVTAPYNPQSRALCVSIEGPKSWASCRETHPSDRAMQDFRYPSLPAGEYVVEGRLLWVDNKSGRMEAEVTHDKFVIRGE